MRILSIPAIRDRVVREALKLILEPIFEADLQPGSFGYRPKRTAHAAVKLVADAIVRHKTQIVALDPKAYFDNVRHGRLVPKVTGRVDDDDVMHMLKMMLRRPGRRPLDAAGHPANQEADGAAAEAQADFRSHRSWPILFLPTRTAP